jgi:GNAT superfamily N-acetyltransferase
MADDELRGILDDAAVEIYALSVDGRDEGLLELDFRESGSCELAFFGLTDAVQGRGAGRWLMNRALELAWRRPIDRLWVHTCTFDHPQALAFYRRSGFRAYARRIEIADDPRLTGLASPTSAAHVPVIGALR